MTEVSPETRKELLDSVAHTTELWLDEVMKGYFAQPKSSFAQQIMLEAFARALVKMVRKTPNHDSLIQTYIFELQETLKDPS